MQANASLAPPHGGFGFIHLGHTQTRVSMLIIPRSKGQAIVIRDNIIVHVIDVEGDEVRLSIEYPEGVSVQTGELVAEREGAVKEPAAV